MKKRIILLIAVYILTFVMPVFGEQEEFVNVSIHQQTIASSQIENINESQMAVDGINDNASYTHWRNHEDDMLPWWQVDLSLEREIHRIEIEAPIGSENAEERKNFRIIGSVDESFSDYVVLVEEVTQEYNDVFVADIVKKDNVRYVRIEKTKEGSLALGEVRVIIKRGGDAVEEEIADVAPVIPESESSELPRDVIGTLYEQDVALLSALGIMRGYEDGLFLPEKQISRAEFAKIAVTLSGNIIKSDKTSFMDVTNGHWAHPYVETAVSSGLINGMGDGNFMPDEAITTPQVVKILVSVLGYKDFAEKAGGYPYGYQSIATELDLYDGTDVLKSDLITRGEVAKLVANALECEKMMVKGITGNYTIAEVTKNETLLLKNFNIAKDDGIVNAVDGISLTDSAPKSNIGTIQIDETIYVTELEGLNAYLGLDVEFYYDLDDSGKVVAITAKRQNEVLKIDADELIDIQDRILIYGKENEEDVEFAKSVDVIYNGVALRNYQKADLLPKEGYVKLIDNDRDSVFDVYVVCAIEHYLVNWVNASEEKIYVSGGDAIKLDFKNDIISLRKKSDDATVDATLEEIKENNVLSVMVSKNTSGDKVYDIVASDDYIEGVVTEIAAKTISVDGTIYNLSSEFNKTTVNVGSKYLFRLTAEGEIFCFDQKKAGELQYGYLIAVDEENIIDETIKFKIFNESGKVVILNGAELGKISVDGYDYKTSKEIISHLMPGGRETGKLHQPIKYSVNGKNEVVAIDTTIVGKETDSIKKDFDVERRYYKSTGVIGMQFGVDDKTVMFKVPDDIARENEFEIMSKNSLSNNSQYTLEAYDCGKDKIAGMLLFSGSTSSATATAMLFMVDEITLTVNEKGEMRKVLKGLYRGKEVEFPEYDDGVIDSSELKRGDIIGLTLTENDEIKSYSKKFYVGDVPQGADERAISTNSPQFGNPYSTIYYGYGKVVSKKDGMISIEYANSETASYKSMLVNVNDDELAVYYYDKNRDRVMIGNSDYILDAETVGANEASYVMINVDSGDVKELVIFN